MAPLLKQFSVYGLVALLLVQCFGRELLLANFILNRASITARFCVNKARPSLHCNGQCYFAKQLKKQQERENKAPESLKVRLDMLPGTAALRLPTRPATYPVAAARHRPAAVPAVPTLGLRGIFRPPQRLG